MSWCGYLSTLRSQIQIAKVGLVRKENVMKELNRREFLGKSAGGLATGLTAANSWAQTTPDTETFSIATLRPLRKTYRAAAIGSTGHGNFGHGLDKAFRCRRT